VVFFLSINEQLMWKSPARLAVVGFLVALASGKVVCAASHDQRPISELKPIATIQIGKTADWVAISADAVWVGSTGPNAIHRG
jgi:hypothetical protein